MTEEHNPEPGNDESQSHPDQNEGGENEAKEKFWEGGSSGAHGSASAELEVLVEAKQEIILGVSSELVCGEELSVALIGVQYLHGGWLIDFTLGEAMEGYLGDKTEIGLARTEAHAQETEIKGLKQEIEGNATEISAVHEIVRGQAAMIAASFQEVDALADRVAGEEGKVTALETRCSAQNFKIAAEAVDTLAQQTAMLAESVKMIAQHTGMVGQRTDMNGDETALCGPSTLICAGRIVI